jgi:L-fuconolactonase
MPTIDAHVHLWDPDRLTYRWLAGTRLERRYGPGDLEAEFDGAFDVRGVVVVQGECLPSQAWAEVEWLDGLNSPLIRGVVAYAPLETPAAGEAVQRCAGTPLVVGVRRNIQDEPAGFATDPAFVAGVRAVGEAGLPFDACVREHQVAEVVELAQACEQTSIVLDHVGKPRVGHPGWRDWSAVLRRLAALPTTYCKLSGLATEAPAFHPALIRPYLQEALAAFGPSRCLFGSDWPVLTTATTYREWIELVLDVVPSSDVDSVMGGTATAVYGLEGL